jgi:hypothetical protein
LQGEIELGVRTPSKAQKSKQILELTDISKSTKLIDELPSI